MPATRATGSYECKVEAGDVLIAIGAASSAAETSTAAPVGQVVSAAPTVHQPGQEPATASANIPTAPSGVPAADVAAAAVDSGSTGDGAECADAGDPDGDLGACQAHLEMLERTGKNSHKSYTRPCGMS